MSDALIASWTEWLRLEISGAVAVLLKGSHVRGDAGPNSDIDFDVLVDGDSVEAYPLWFATDDTGRTRHISVAVKDLAGWLADGDEPEPWAFGLPVREPTRLLWAASDEVGEALDRPWREHPPEEPELEDWLECYGKMRNAALRGDELGMRQAAQGLGRYTPTLLRPLNPEVWATSPRSALDLALAFPVAPDGYRLHMLACLGLANGVPVDTLIHAAERLVGGTLALLDEHIDAIAPLLATDIAGYLRDGALKRYIEGMVEEAG